MSICADACKRMPAIQSFEACRRAQRKTRQVSLEAAGWRREAVFTFLKGHHLTPIDTMTTTTYTLQTADVQELNDEQLEQTTGGFLPFKVFALFHIAKTIVQCFRPRD